jgi:hypothetical protein
VWKRDLKVYKRIYKCAKRAGEYSLGLKVYKRSFLGILRVWYEGLSSMMLQSMLFRGCDVVVCNYTLGMML